MHQELCSQVTTAGQGGYNATINNIYGTGATVVINIIKVSNLNQPLYDMATDSLNDITTGLESHGLQLEQ